MFDRFLMSKATITRLFLIAVALVVAGAVIGAFTIVTALASGAVTFGGPQFVSFDLATVAWSIAALVVGSLLGGAGTAVAIAAWAGALVNTYRLADKTWFYALLGSGLVSLGWVAMIGYVFAGPDGSRAPAARQPVGQPARS